MSIATSFQRQKVSTSLASYVLGEALRIQVIIRGTSQPGRSQKRCFFQAPLRCVRRRPKHRVGCSRTRTRCGPPPRRSRARSNSRWRRRRFRRTVCGSPADGRQAGDCRHGVQPAYRAEWRSRHHCLILAGDGKYVRWIRSSFLRPSGPVRLSHLSSQEFEHLVRPAYDDRRENADRIHANGNSLVLRYKANISANISVRAAEINFTEFEDRLDASGAAPSGVPSRPAVSFVVTPCNRAANGTFISNDSLTNERRMIGRRKYFSYVCAQNWIV
jgi:hypothetical protein